MNELLAQLQNEVPSFPRPYQTTHQQREASLAEAWGNERRRIFKNYVSQQPLRHSKCDNCSKQFNKSAVRCMYCKKHFCFKCDTETHLTSPFHRRHLVSSDDLITLLPDMFIDQNSEIIRKGTITVILNDFSITNLFCLRVIKMCVCRALFLVNAKTARVV